jgi:hypothetical protein
MPEISKNVNSTNAMLLYGTTLAHKRLDFLGKAFLGAELIRGEKVLIAPTLTQVAKLLGASTSSVKWADRRFDDREAIETGWLPLVPPRSRPKPLSAAATLPPNDEISDFELANVIRRAGIARTLDIAVKVEAAE